MEYIWFGRIFILVIKDKVYRISIVDIIVIIIDIMLIVWFGVKDTKYENITSIPLM